MAEPPKGVKTEEKPVEKVSRFRCVLAQIVATSVKNLLLFNLGLCFSLPTIVIPALTGVQNVHNQNEFLTITPVQASWMGSIGYFVQPFGSILSAIITDPLGRKRSMILVNIPFFIGWFMMSQANSVFQILSGFVMLGMSVGIMEAPIVTYLGEICEPSTRGVLIGYTFICGTIGMLTIYVLNTLMAWRTVAMLCSAVPIITAIAICFIPETPQWLLSKNRNDDAEKSLQWLRGWVSRETVEQEFQGLQRHSEASKSCNMCIKQNLKCPHPLPTMVEKFAELKRKRTIKPFVIVISLFILTQFSGMMSMRPFIVQIFKAYDSPIHPDKAAAVMSLLDNLANVTFMLLVRFTGKRRLYLINLTCVILCALVVTIYGFMYLPTGYISFDQAHQMPFKLENQNLGYIPLVSLLLWSYFSFCGLIGMPWMFLSELFPFKSRGIASGIAAAVNYFFGFVTKKTYYNLETSLSIPGVSLLYLVICCIGLVFTYFILPETEDRSLEDIELHFSDNSKNLTNWKIAKSKVSNKTKKTKDSDKSKDLEKSKNAPTKMNICSEKANDNSNKSSSLGVDNKAFEMDSAKM